MSQKVDMQVRCPYCGGEQLQPVVVAVTQGGVGPAQVLYCSDQLPIRNGGANGKGFGCGKHYVTRVVTRYEIETGTINLDQG